jgi:hypothetical protein
MTTTIAMDKIYAHSENVLEKEIEGILLIIPLKGGIQDKESHLPLTEPGRALWDALDGKRTMREVLSVLAEEFMAGPGEIERDVFFLMVELLNREMLVEVSTA